MVYNPFIQIPSEEDIKEEPTSILPFEDCNKIYLRSIRLSGTVTSRVTTPVYVRVFLISTYLRQMDHGFSRCTIPIWRTGLDESNGFISDYIDYSKCRVLRRRMFKLYMTNEKSVASKLININVKLEKFLYPNKQTGGDVLGRFTNLYWVIQAYSETKGEEIVSIKFVSDVNYKEPQ